MKKALKILLLLVFVVSLSACAKNNSQETTETKKEETAKEDTNKVEVKKDEEKKEENFAERKGTLTTNVDLSKYDKGKSVKLWLPIPQDSEYQKISNVKVDLDEAHAKQQQTTDKLGNKMLYVEWDNEATDRKVSLSFDAERKEIKRGELTEKEDQAKKDELKEFLQPHSMMPVDGKVKELADKITEGKTTDLDKVKAIYDWTIANMNRDESVKGCGTGEVEKLLDMPQGKCTDIHSVFVALCRASGVPAREIFGVRMSKKASDDETKGQHCWSEFYLQGHGWVKADPGDVLKAVLKQKLDKSDEKTKELADYYWGGMDSLRVALTTGRDLTLEPKQDDKPLNNFGYPYAEVEGKALDYYNPADFEYNIKFEEAK